MSAAGVSWDDVAVGDALPAQSFEVSRSDLVRYAGASGDFNRIHWDEVFARSVGLPDVIAHGMFTMARAGRVVTDWAGDPGAVLEYSVRFSRQVPVAREGGAVLEVAATIGEKLDGRKVRVDLVATSGGVKVLASARAIVQLT